MAFTVNQKVIAEKYRKESVGAHSKFIKTLGTFTIFSGWFCNECHCCSNE